MTAHVGSHEISRPASTRQGLSLDGGMTKPSLAIEGDLLQVQP